MSEELGWSLEDFDKAFQEVFDQGMVKADFSARVIWIPNAIKHNRPESPNVVISWGKEIDLIPECALKNEAITALYKHMQLIDSESYKPEKRSYSAAFEKVFGKALMKPFRKASRKAMPNQEQEQEQEQEQDQNLLRSAEKIHAAPPEENLESCGLNLHDGTRPAHAGPERRPLSAGVPEMPRPDDPEFIRLPLNDGSEFTVGESLVSELESLYPAVDVRQALRNQRGWLLSDRRRLKTARGIKKFITGWLAKDQDRGGNRGRDSPHRMLDIPEPDNVIPPGFRG
ncbi:hypothetical protein DQK56_00240 [Salmonella enterica subsp. enterica serovar Brandenburg]|nr:hypothetical protein [Salmonella enterica subsp. enterica serovar Brandenburg]